MFNRPTSGSIVCPSCGSLVGVRDDACFRCGRRNPGLWGFAPMLQKLGLDLGFPQIVITVCAAMYVLTLLSDPGSIRSGGLLSMLSPGTRPLFLFGASGTMPVFGYGRWWTILSAAWLHGGLLHIGMNMMWLRQLMPAVADMYGTSRLVIIYTVSAATGFAATSVMGLFRLGPLSGAGFTVGASAPLFGLFGALVVYSNRAGASALGQQVWRWVMMFVIIGLLIPMIDNWAHLGGFAGGYVVSRFLDPLEDEAPHHVMIALVCLGLNAASIIASVLLGVQFFPAT